MHTAHHLQTHRGLSGDTWPLLMHLIQCLALVTTSTWFNAMKHLRFKSHWLSQGLSDSIDVNKPGTKYISKSLTSVLQGLGRPRRRFNFCRDQDEQHPSDCFWRACGLVHELEKRTLEHRGPDQSSAATRTTESNTFPFFVVVCVVLLPELHINGFPSELTHRSIISLVESTHKIFLFN